jgi:hypothetical protein
MIENRTNAHQETTHVSHVVPLDATIPMQDLAVPEQQDDTLPSSYQLNSLADVVLHRCSEYRVLGPAALKMGKIRNHRIEPTTHEASTALMDTTTFTFHESDGTTNFIPPLAGLDAFQSVGNDSFSGSATSLYSATTDATTQFKTIPGPHYVETENDVETANAMAPQNSAVRFGTNGHDTSVAHNQHQLEYPWFNAHGTSALAENGKNGTVLQLPQWHMEMKWALEMLAAIDDAKRDATPRNGSARCSHPLMDYCVTLLLQLAIPPPLAPAAAAAAGEASSQSSLQPVVATALKCAPSPVYDRLEYLTLLLDMMQRHASSPSLNAMALYLVYCDVATIRRRKGREHEHRRRRFYRRQWHRVWLELGSAVVSAMERFADFGWLQEVAMNVLLACTIHRPGSVHAAPSVELESDWPVDSVPGSSAPQWSRSLMLWDEDFWFDATYSICREQLSGRINLPSPQHPPTARFKNRPWWLGFSPSWSNIRNVNQYSVKQCRH